VCSVDYALYGLNMCVKELFGERLAMIVHNVTIAAKAVYVETTNVVASSTPRG